MIENVFAYTTRTEETERNAKGSRVCRVIIYRKFESRISNTRQLPDTNRVSSNAQWKIRIKI